MAAWNGFYVKAVDFRDATVAALFKERSRQFLLATGGDDASGERRQKLVARACAAICSRDVDATLVGYEKGIDDVDARAHVAQQPCQKGARHRGCIQLRDFARVFYLNFAHSRLIQKLRGKSSQTLCQPYIRLKLIESFSA
jgi:hypothetical protein